MTKAVYTPQDLHAQTARVAWPELEKHFARGVVIHIDSDLDLVLVATGFANDDKTAVDQWVAAGRVQHLDLQTAKDWAARNPDLWAVVVAPWVLVQERRVGSGR
jgi:hypothetical protein